ncbi:glucose dehydrogenase [FAD, quinone]-like [Toxorhynchites rutilus septentrionalis]|uniref:glucose dehydrogenase [FAD, quinone]-like n=1 Tax=Toxorhynchites rutilus septentrionalis TaxID=329112 RepID=UPI00247B2167|nr:glucose dehydrogenase [FAD, quinone]-like [Toxorhynchites rutilus septentrionalis]
MVRDTRNSRLRKGIAFVIILVLCCVEGENGFFGYKHGFSEYSGHVTPKEYDFIVVGGGNAGAVLASRLSEITQWKILLIEAGGRDNPLSDVPLFAAYLQSTAFNWNFVAEKQNNFCLGLKNGRCPLPRGKGLGGSTIINYMIYNRGNPADFDRWAAMGNKQWSYREVLPYFKKSEKVTFEDTNRPPQHGKGGPVNVEYVPHRSPLVHAFIEANKQLGRGRVDYNGGSQIGVDYLQATTKRGKRVTSASAYLSVGLDRPNLTILTNARATRIVIDRKTKIARGVEYLQNKKRYTVYARKEVILSAGTFQSPQLLMLSGVGPRDHLQELNIPVLVNSPVGKTMYDHLCLIALTFITNTTKASFDTDRIGAREILQYKAGTGILTAPGALEALAFVKTNISREKNDIPDIELLFLGGSTVSDHGTGSVKSLKWREDIYDKVYKPYEGRDQFTIAVMLFHPNSRGYIRLKNSNPLHWPLVFSNFLTAPDDLKVMIEGIKEAIRIGDTPAMKAIGARLNDTPLPTCTQYPFGTDTYWECAIRSLANTLHHQVGTSRMGPAGDPGAVVSPDLKVYGVKNLRVVDASIMPYIVTGHTQAAVYMIAEKAADMIKDHWNWGQELNEND